MNEDEIREYLTQLLVGDFGIEPEAIEPQADLFKDLGIDSIDAVDLLLHVKKLTGTQVSPQQFKNVRTIDDVVKMVQGIGTT